MLSLISLLILIGEIWLAAGAVMLLHSLSPRIGISPLMLYLGALTALLQFNVPGAVAPAASQTGFQSSLLSYVFLPAIMLGILIIYAVNGTMRARSAFWGLLAVILLTTAVQILLPLQLPGAAISPGTTTAFSPFVFLAFVPALAVDLLLLVITYQALLNLHHKTMRRLSGGVSILAGLGTYALLFPLLVSFNSPDVSRSFLAELALRVVSGIALFPLAVFYLSHAAQFFPYPSGAASRPVLDIFSTAFNYTARTRSHYNLLRTVSAINQLIVRSDDPARLLEQACQKLVQSRVDLFCWFGVCEQSPTKISLTASAGYEKGFLDSLRLQGASIAQYPAIVAACQKGESLLARNLAEVATDSPWIGTPHLFGLKSAIVLPARYAGSVSGAMAFFSSRVDAFDREETELLQELADDLVYAVIGLEARRQQAILKAAAESMHDGMIIANLKGEILYINDTCAKLIHRSAAELTGENINSLAPAGDLQKVFQTYYQALLQRGSLAVEFETNDLNGQPLFVGVRGSLVRDNQEQPAYIIVSVEDITQRRQYEHQLLTLNQLITELVQIHDSKALLSTLLHNSEELLHADASAIYILNPETKAVTQFITHNVDQAYASRIARDYRGLPGETVLRTMKPVIVEDTLASAEYGERIHFMAEYGIRSLLVLPVGFQNQALGALVLYHHKPHTYDEAEQQLSLTLSNTLAITIQNARLYEAERSHRELAEALAEAAVSLNRSLNLERVLDQILDQIRRVAACQFVNILLIEGKAAYIARSKGYEEYPNYPKQMSGFIYPLTLPTIQTMLQSRLPLVIPDTQQDARWTVMEASEWIRSYAGAPLLVGEQVVGFLEVDSGQPGYFSEEIASRLQAFAAHAAIAIQNARLYRQLQQYAMELENRVGERTAELQSAKDRIEGILASVPDALFVLDDSSQLLQVNPAGETLLAQAVAREIDLFTAGRASSKTGRLLPAEEMVVEVQGRSYQPLASRFQIEPEKSGQIIVFRDVTRFRELDKMKSQFVSDVSHELRTPLTNLTIYLDLIANIADAPKRQSYLETLRRETARLTHLIEGLLTISRLDAGRTPIHMKPVDICQLISELVQDRAALAASQGLTLNILSGATPTLPLAQADALLLSQCISNLLTNAINYTPAGGTISLQAGETSDSQGQWVTATVSDTGMGIPADELPHIFERFFRGSASRTMAAPGTGLGLAIAHEITNRMNAKITVESQPGQGSAFTLWLRPAG